MTGWLERLSAAVGEPPLTDHEIRTLLDVARDVAHSSERRHAPLSTFLLGLSLGRADVADRTAGLDDLAARVAALLEDRTGD